jgi:hypothetical protein
MMRSIKMDATKKGKPTTCTFVEETRQPLGLSTQRITQQTIQGPLTTLLFQKIGRQCGLALTPPTGAANGKVPKPIEKQSTT